MQGERVAGKYELKRLLGAGSMGAVYECVHVDLGKRLAIKLIHPEFGESQEVVGRFRREARAASAVESDYIVQIYDFGTDEALGLYMVIEYLEGEDLEARLLREKWVSIHDAATIGVQVARGLAKAHAAKIIHRDLKPANVFLTKREDGSILSKILDFGISKLDPGPGNGELPEPTLTAFGTTLGTPQYMSPEQCEGKLVLDGRADVWALCAVLYEMLAGEPAVDDQGGHIATMAHVLREDVKPLGPRAPWVPAKLASVVDAGLVRERDRRIPDASTLAAKLIEAYPEAAHRPAFGSALAHVARPTDISELAFDDAPPATMADPGPRLFAPTPFEQTLAAPGLPKMGLADTANPPSSTDGPASSTGERVQVFVREKDLPAELASLRKRNKDP